MNNNCQSDHNHPPSCVSPPDPKLIAEGWERRFIADAKRAQDAIEMYAEMGHEVRIVVPKYGAVDDRKFKIHEVVRLKDLQIKIGDKDVQFSLKSCFLPAGPVLPERVCRLNRRRLPGWSA